MNLMLVYLAELSMNSVSSLVHSYPSSPEAAGVCLHDRLFTWLLGIRTQVLLLV